MTRTDSLLRALTAEIEARRERLDAADAHGAVNCELKFRRAGQKTDRITFSFLFAPGDPLQLR